MMFVKDEKNKVVIHEQICDSIKELYKAKNADYGESYANLRRKYHNSICIRLYDKLTRLEVLMDKRYAQQVKNESIEDTLIDIANYAIMELTEMEYDKQNENVKG